MINKDQIKEALLGALTREWEYATEINRRAGTFSFYIVKQCFEELSKDGKLDTLQIRGRMKYRKMDDPNEKEVKT